ncbi:hypothetical protein PRIPAC_83292 [Pristionchus pacificus]|uniref:Copper transport protein n=1 Tax=Pristionchus pacificus TaxID=54126 RepID=A0A2A6BLL8_PRIPA|nr:hypothetical protein PRIPAC_83292 [Pristionchus pacificus]|eukprot:PDM66713.1 hypothetical protein PRIPAC_48130 [Pristionchus pacificus]
MDHAGKGHGGMKVDHGSNHGGGGMEMNHGMSHGGGASSGPMMWDWFHTAINETVLFPWWRVTNLRSLLLSCALVAAAGFTLEWLRTVRARLKAGAGSRLIAARHGSLHGGDTMGYATFSAAASKESGLFAGLCSPSHVRDTLLFGVQTALSYTIMMVFMTYSVQLCTALVAGTALGYYVHGRRRRPL